MSGPRKTVFTRTRRQPHWPRNSAQSGPRPWEIRGDEPTTRGKRKKPTNLKKKSIDWLSRQGWYPADVERYYTYRPPAKATDTEETKQAKEKFRGFMKIDLYDFADIMAFHPSPIQPVPVLIQVTNPENIWQKWDKWQDNQILRAWLSKGWRLMMHAWVRPTSNKDFWKLRGIELCLDDDGQIVKLELGYLNV